MKVRGNIHGFRRMKEENYFLATLSPDTLENSYI